MHWEHDIREYVHEWLHAARAAVAVAARDGRVQGGRGEGAAHLKDAAGDRGEVGAEPPWGYQHDWGSNPARAAVSATCRERAPAMAHAGHEHAEVLQAGWRGGGQIGQG